METKYDETQPDESKSSGGLSEIVSPHESIRQVIGPDGFLYKPRTTSESFDKRYFRR